MRNEVPANRRAASLKELILRHATANVVRLGAFSVVALFLPPLLVRHMPKDSYAAWVLILQFSAYVNFLDFGLQGAVSHFVAFTREQGDTLERDKIASSAFALLSVLAALGLGLIAAMAWQLPHVFRAMPVRLQPEARLAVLLVGGTAAFGLPASVMGACFIGEHRNEIPAGTAIIGRVLSAILIVWAVLRFHGSLFWMAAGLSTANLVSYVLQYAAWRAKSNVHIRADLVGRAAMGRLGRYCLGVMVWMAGALLVSGLDMTVVGIVDFADVGYYGIAMTLTLFLIQFQEAVMGALIPAASVLHARDDRRQLGELLVQTTRYGVLLLLVIGLPLILGARPLLQLWVGTQYAPHVAPLLRVLVAANMVRLAGLPYATLVIGTNQQHRARQAPIVEGVVNLVVSVAAGKWLGAIGVALGTLVGAFFSLYFHLVYSMPRTTGINSDRRRLLREGMLQPGLCGAVPTLMFLLLIKMHVSGLLAVSVLVGPTAALTLWMLWTVGIAAPEREIIRAWCRSRRLLSAKFAGIGAD